MKHADLAKNAILYGVWKLELDRTGAEMLTQVGCTVTLEKAHTELDRYITVSDPTEKHAYVIVKIEVEHLTRSITERKAEVKAIRDREHQLKLEAAKKRKLKTVMPPPPSKSRLRGW